MTSTISFDEVSILGWVFACSAAFLMGVSKAGLKGLSIFNVTLMALAFGAKQSTGFIVPLLVVGDVFAVIYYNRHTKWNYIKKLLPWMFIGILLGVFIGKDLPENQFKIGMVALILISLAIIIYWNKRKSKTVPTHWAFASDIGVIAGISTMVGNLAGAFTNLFFLAMRLPKNEFVGTAAWLFLITNLFKLPLHVFVWKTISLETLSVNLRLVPAILVGFFVGVNLVKMINEKQFRTFILIVTAIGAIAILFR